MIKIIDYTDTAFSMHDAEMIDDIIRDELKKNNKVELDFEQITLYTTLFFNTAVTSHVLKLGPEEYQKKFHLYNLNDAGKFSYEHSLENAIEYYNSSPEEQNLREKILKDFNLD